jgi:DNA-binding NtrC family response regulator
MVDAAQVLIVDDEPNVRLVFRAALESAGYEVIEAGDGEEALGLVRGRPFDVVLLDLRMPRLDGLETLRRLNGQGVGVPVVVVSAHGNILDVVLAMKLGAADFVPKPVSPETLRRVVREAAVAGPARTEQSAGSFDLLAREALARARQAIDRGEFEEADFFLGAAVPLGADPGATRLLADEARRRRELRGVGSYRTIGGLTWG